MELTNVALICKALGDSNRLEIEIMLKLTGQKSLQEHIFHICILRAHKDWQQNMATGHQIRIYYLSMVINLI